MANTKKKSKSKKKTAKKRSPSKKAGAKKPKKKRDVAKYPGLNKNLFSRIKQEYFDFDYIDKLGHEDKLWLSQFNEEYLGARLNGSKKPLHRTKRLKKNCFDMNNSRNRDITSNALAGGKMDSTVNLEKEIESKQEVSPSAIEDALIDAIDLKKSQSLKGGPNS